MTKNLGYLSIFVIVIFIPVFELLEHYETLADSLLGKSLIGFIVLGANVPWFYALYKAKEYGDKKLFWYCFFFTVVGAWYFLFKLSGKYEQSAH